jgi:hypothetical protein
MARLFNSAEERKDNLPAQFDARGIELYSSLIEIGRIDLITSIFPIINKLLGKNFKAIALDYFASMPPKHFNLNRAAENFPLYIQKHCPDLIARYPFLAELADYEWIELAVLESPADSGAWPNQKVPSKLSVDAAQFAALTPIVNGAFIARRYNFEIPKIVLMIKEGDKLSSKLLKPAKHFLGVVVYRDPVSLDARFLEVGEVALKLLQGLSDTPGLNYGQVLTTLCEGAAPEEAASLLSGSLEAIEQFKRLNLIVAEEAPD